MTVSADDFKNALRLWASGVSVVTTHTEKYGLQGMTVSAFSSVSVDPPQILVCINERAETGVGIMESEFFAVNVLSQHQQAVSNQFAGGSSQAERFANTSWENGSTGLPLLTESLMSLECRLVDKVLAGTHWILIGEVLQCVCRTGDPLLYYSGNYRQLADLN